MRDRIADRYAKGRRVHTYVLLFLRIDRSDHDVAR